MRIERDSFGDIEVPDEALWGAQTARSLRYFRIGAERQPPELIRALALVKRAAAEVNEALGELAPDKAGAIVRAAAGSDGRRPRRAVSAGRCGRRAPAPRPT